MNGLNTETEFEQTFADLSFAYIQDKAPGLVDYLVGFQVLDVNEDKTRAVGVFGAEVGREFLYMPVFFMNGELKGHELMYLKDQDIFVPLEEAWIQYILNKKPQKLGDTTTFDPKDLVGGTNLYDVRRSPELGKSASMNARPDYKLPRRIVSLPCWFNETANWAEKAASAFNYKHLADYMGKTAGANDLSNMINNFDGPTFRKFVTVMQKNAGFSASIKTFYPDSLGELLKKAANDYGLVDTKEPNVNDVVILSRNEMNTYDAFNLSDSEKTQLIDGEIIIKDHRDSTSKAFSLQVPLAHNTPNTSGIYEAVTMEGKSIDVYLIKGKKTFSCCTYEGESAIGSRNSRSRDWVINLTGDGVSDCTYTNKSNFPFLQKKQDGKSNFSNYDLGELNASYPSEGEAYFIASSTGCVVEPFRVVKKIKNADGTTVLYTSTRLVGHRNKNEDCDRQDLNDCVKIIISEHLKGEITKTGKIISVPSECSKVVKIKVKKLYHEDGHPKYSEDYGMPALVSCESLQHYVWTGQRIIPVRIYADENNFELTFNRGRTAEKKAGFTGYRNALTMLVKDYGLDGTTAKEMLKSASTASATGVRRAEFGILPAKGYPMNKQANPALLGAGPNAPAIPDPTTYNDPSVSVPAVEPFTDLSHVSELEATNTPMDPYNPDPNLDNDPLSQSLNAVEQAAATGQKEVFDTAVLGALLSSSDTDNLISKYVSDLVLGVDRIGRIYFLYLQHYDDFKDRYGDQDLVELESNLKDTFVSLGQLVLFLKQKTVDASPALNDMEVQD